MAVDLECTGNDFRKGGEICQIGAIVVNEKIEETSAFMTYVFPNTAYRDPEAMAVNKIKETDLASAPRMKIALKSLSELYSQQSKRIPVGAWGIHFDIPFLRAAYFDNGMEYPFSGRCFDMKSAAIWALATKGIPFSGSPFKAAKVLEFIDKNEYQKLSSEIDTLTQHDAIFDVKAALAVLRAISKL